MSGYAINLTFTNVTCVHNYVFIMTYVLNLFIYGRDGHHYTGQYVMIA